VDSISSLPEPLSQAAQWLAAARAGSIDALGRALELCRRYLLQVAGGELDPQLQAKAGASDLVQETFLEAQRIFDRFQGVSSGELRAWLRAILLNKVATHTRRYRATASRQIDQEVGLTLGSDHQIDLAGTISTPSSMMVVNERAQALTAAVQRLPDHYRQIVLWRQMENLSFEEMAARLGRSVEAIRKLWWRAIQQLQQELGDSL
jgi:RNA polymerase sigma-70 factor (ECF subfamily)